MIEIVNKFEKSIYALLMIMLMVVLITSLVELAVKLWGVIIDMKIPSLIEPAEMIGVFGGFLLVLIGVELLDTIKAYFIENTIHVEIIVLLAIIAMARKVILLNPTPGDSYSYAFDLMGIGVIIVGLSIGYYLIKKASSMSYPVKK